MALNDDTPLSEALNTLYHDLMHITTTNTHQTRMLFNALKVVSTMEDMTHITGRTLYTVDAYRERIRSLTEQLEEERDTT